jgi:hypothetical protein
VPPPTAARRTDFSDLGFARLAAGIFFPKVMSVDASLAIIIFISLQLTRFVL